MLKKQFYFPNAFKNSKLFLIILFLTGSLITSCSVNGDELSEPPTYSTGDILDDVVEPDEED